MAVRSPTCHLESVWKTEEKSSYVSAVIAGAPAGKIVIGVCTPVFFDRVESDENTVRDGNRWKTIDGKQRVDAFAV